MIFEVYTSLRAEIPFLRCIQNSKVVVNRMDKTCYSVFSPNKIPVSIVTIKINDVKITCVKECKYLG